MVISEMGKEFIKEALRMDVAMGMESFNGKMARSFKDSG